jgi:hypothetical protein
VQSTTVEAMPMGGLAAVEHDVGGCEDALLDLIEVEPGAGMPLVFAEVAMMGPPEAWMSSMTTSWSGLLSATVSSSARKSLPTTSEAFTTRLRAPGQNALARLCAYSGTSTP